MRQKTLLVIVVLSLLLVPVMAAEEKPMDPVVGTWVLSSDFNGSPMNSLLIVSKDKDGKYQGQWVSFFGISPVQNLKIQDGKVSFTQTNQFGGQEFSMNFSGSISKDGVLTGTMGNDQFESTYEGKRMKPFEPIVGVWEFRTQRGDREVVNTMTVGRDKDGQYTVDWEGGFGGRRGQAEGAPQMQFEISNVKYEDGKLTFTRSLDSPQFQFETNYSLTANGDTISGTSTSQRGEREMEGKRVGTDLVGMWELAVSSEMGGDRTQTLWILPDMTAWFGSNNVGKINVADDGTISFTYEMGFGDQTFENGFKGKVVDGTLTAEMTNQQGTQQVKGKKMVKK